MEGFFYFYPMSSKSGIILFDPKDHKKLWPLNLTKPIAHLRLSYFTIQQQWQHISQILSNTLPVAYLKPQFSTTYFNYNFYVNASIIPNKKLWAVIAQMPIESILKQNEKIIAIRSKKHINKIEELHNFEGDENQLTFEVKELNNPASIFKLAGEAILLDELVVDKNCFSNPKPLNGNLFFNAKNIWVHPTATLKAVTINAEEGPVIIGENALIMEGALLRGPICIGDHSVVKMGAKIYGPTTIGPHCKVGGEINNTVFQAYSNKGHDGYLGNAVIGAWCNLGADTNCSNLKNNYSKVKVWSYQQEDFVDSGTQFHGLIMGDHSKCSINTMFNTGTVVGAFANIFGSGFHNKFIPSFSWGKKETYNFDKAIETAKRVMQRKNLNLGKEAEAILKSIFEQTQSYRNQFL